MHEFESNTYGHSNLELRNSLSFATVSIVFTLDVQIRDVTMGDSANFTCCANGTDITLHWEIQERGNNYSDCSDQGFCVRNMSEVNSVCSTLEIDTAQVNRRETIVRCVVEQMFGEQTNRNISTGQLTVRDMACKFTCIPPILIWMYYN